jgi:F-type H+-transporting ATPase subunit b
LEGLSELGINLPSLLAQLVNFALLLGLLYLVAYKPIMKKLDERSNKIKESMEQTEQIKKQAEQAEEGFKARVEEASQQGQLIIDRATRTSEEIRQKARREASEEAEALLARARAEIRRERDEVIDELRREYADLTIMAAEKIIERSLDKKAHRQIIDKVLEESQGLKKG